MRLYRAPPADVGKRRGARLGNCRSLGTRVAPGLSPFLRSSRLHRRDRELIFGRCLGRERGRSGRAFAVTWIFVGTLALLFALRLYRQLQDPPWSEVRQPARVLSNRAKLSASGDEPTVAFSSRLGRAGRTAGRTAENGGDRV